MSTAGKQGSRTGAVGCSATPMPRWMKWSCGLAFVAAVATTIVGAVAPSPLMWVASVVATVAGSLAVIVVGLWAAFPELFRRNR